MTLWCLEPVLLTPTPSFIWIANGISLISPTHAVHVGEDKSLCSFPMQTMEVWAQHRVGWERRATDLPQQVLPGRGFAGRRQERHQRDLPAISPGIESPPLPSTCLPPLLANPASPTPTLQFQYGTVGASRAVNETPPTPWPQL